MRTAYQSIALKIKDEDLTNGHNGQTALDQMRSDLNEEGGGCVDIYQLAAVCASGNVWKLHQFVWVWVRALVCTLLQLVVTPIAIYMYVQEESDNEYICEGWVSHDQWIHKGTGTLICIYLLANFYTCVGEETHPSNTAIYPLLKGDASGRYTVEFLSDWSLAGLLINNLAYGIASLGSVVMIYNSNTVFDMVLNSLALSFIYEFDDQIVTAADKDLVAKHLEGLRPDQVCKKRGPQSLLFVCHALTNAIWFVSAAGMTLSPFYMAYCY